MRTFITSLLALFLNAGVAFALAPLGPPVADLEQQQISIGFDYSFGETDVEVSGYGVSDTVDVDSDMFLAKFAYGITDGWNVFLRLGATSLDSDGFDSGTEFAWGIGTKGTVLRNEQLSWGLLGQIHWFEGDDTWAYAGYAGSSEVDAYEIKVAAGPAYQLDNVCIYGGPFLQFIEGDWDIKSGGAKVSFDVEEESAFGAYIGANVPLTELVNFNGELQVTGDAWVLAVGLLYRLQ